jgi:hypothetical protein
VTSASICNPQIVTRHTTNNVLAGIGALVVNDDVGRGKGRVVYFDADQ